MSRTRRIVTTCLALALVGYFIYFAANALDAGVLMDVLSSPRQVAAVLVAAVLYALIIPVTAWAWRRLLLVQGERWPVPKLAELLGLTQLAKYIPGNIAQHATRAALCLRAGMGMRPLVTTVSQETILAIAASLLVGAIMLALSKPGFAQLSQSASWSLLTIGVGLVVAVALLASLRLSPERLLAHPNRLMRMLGKVGGLPGPTATFGALAAYAFNYLMIGIGLFGLARAVGLPADVDFSLVTATFALSWAMGFLAPGAPAGLGAREGIMLLLLRGSAPDESLLVFVLLARVVTMSGDALCFIGASILRARMPPAHKETA